jgi:putative membrane protein
MRLLLAWLSNCVALLAAAVVVPAIGYQHDWGALLLAGAILGLVNLVLRPLVVLLALPAVVLSLGLALLVVNALMLELTSALVPDLHTGGFLSTLAGAVVVSLVNLALRPWRTRHGRPRRRARARTRSAGRR